MTGSIGATHVSGATLDATPAPAFGVWRDDYRGYTASNYSDARTFSFTGPYIHNTDESIKAMGGIVECRPRPATALTGLPVVCLGGLIHISVDMPPGCSGRMLVSNFSRSFNFPNTFADLSFAEMTDAQSYKLRQGKNEFWIPSRMESKNDLELLIPPDIGALGGQSAVNLSYKEEAHTMLTVAFADVVLDRDSSQPMVEVRTLTSHQYELTADIEQYRTRHRVITAEAREAIHNRAHRDLHNNGHRVGGFSLGSILDGAEEFVQEAGPAVEKTLSDVSSVAQFLGRFGR